ncbi:MAG: signal peptidase II [Gammaproteobacteria bacterium]|nr:signal peptidase II [Gammaproteobacteria bacterium]MDH5800310.1 signal peptidase II [Gammaproteobacteria bacterium]
MPLQETAQRAGLLSLVVIFCIAGDQITKEIAIRYLADSPALSYGFDTLRFQYAENPGAFLSLGANLSVTTRFWVFTVFSTVLLLGMSIYVFISKQMNRFMLVSFALMIGGGFSNLIDRIGNQGRVVDFINLGIGNLRTGIFNVADMVVLLGALFLIWGSRRIRD